MEFFKVPLKGKFKVKRANIFGKVEEVDKRSEWLRQLGVHDNSEVLYVCSLHFSKNNYSFPEIHSKLRILKPNTIPLPVKISKEKRARNLQRQNRAMRRSKISEYLRKESINSSTNQNLNQEQTVQLSENTVDQENVVKDKNVLPDLPVPEEYDHESEPEHHESDCEFHAEPTNVDDSQTNVEDSQEIGDYLIISNNSEKENKDVCVQVSSGDFKQSLSSFIHSEKDLMTMCGIKSFNILHTLARIMDEIYPVQRRHMLSTVEKIILTTARLKLDISFSVLAIFFNQSFDVTVRNIFYDTLKKLSTILQAVVKRVPKEQIMRNMPKCFSKYKSTTSVLDCTEVKIQKPKCLKCRVKFYSYHKSDLTVKFMTEVSPAGILTFVNESFGGRASDKCIFEYSSILNHLESTRDVVMVDRGFRIDEECLQKRIQLIRPPFLKSQTVLGARSSTK